MSEVMKPTYIGFNGLQPHAIIIWKRDGQQVSKTICYDEQELEEALARHIDGQDYYHQFKPSVHMMEEKICVQAS